MEALDPTKQWAVGLSPDEFKIQFQQRYPFAAGILPNLKKWLQIKPKEFDGVMPFNEELIEGENVINQSKAVEVKEPEKVGFEVVCPGCEKNWIKDTEKKANAAMRAHKRFCKELLKSRG